MRGDIRSQIKSDAQRGALAPLGDYVARFPGAEAEVTRVYDAVRAEFPEALEPQNDPPTPLEQASRETMGAEGLARLSRRDHEVLEEIARGGMGIVYAIRDDVLRRELAMKKITLARVPEETRDFASAASLKQVPQLIRRLMEEAQITAQLDHSGVVPVHELGIDSEGHLYFTMKRVHGRTLGEIFRMVRSRGEDWSLSRALQVFLKICQTLAYAHRKGVIHRDLKPANIMVGQFGEVYVMDWGLAKVRGAQELPASDDPSVETAHSELARGDASHALTMHGDVLGTLGYMAPEQARGDHASLDERTDVYAVGAMLYELLAGHAPYREPAFDQEPDDVIQAMRAGPPIALDRVAPDAPPELVSIAAKAMEHDPALRFQSMEEMSDDLHAFLDGRVVKSHQTGVWIELKKWIERNQILAASIVFGVVLALVIAGAFLVQQREAAVAIKAQRDVARSEAEAAEAARGEAQREARRADGLRLAAQARLQAEHDPAVALPLALAAHERAPGRASLEALYRAIDRSRLAGELEGHEAYVHQVAFTPDGRWLVSFDHAGNGVIWDVEKRTVRHWLDGSPGMTMAMAFTGDGRHVATAHATGVLQGFEIESGKRVAYLPDADAQDIFFVGEGFEALLARHDGTVWHRAHLFEDTGTRLTAHGLPWKDPSPYVPHVQFAEAPHGVPVICWWGADGRVVAYDPALRKLLWDMDSEGKHAFRRKPGYERALSQDGRGRGLALCWSDGNGVHIDIPSGRVLRRFEGTPDEHVHVLRLSQDGERLFASFWQRQGAARVEWYRTADGTLGRTIQIGEHGELRVLSPDGREFVLERRFDAEVWDADTGARRHELRGHRYRLRHTCYDPEQRYVATVSDDMTVRLWFRDGPGVQRGILPWLRRGAHFLRLAGNGQYVYLHHLPGHPPRHWGMIDTGSGELLATYPFDGPLVHWVDEEPHANGQFAVNEAGDVIHIDSVNREVKTVTRLAEWGVHSDTVRVSPDHRLLFARRPGEAKPFFVWRLSDGQVVSRFGEYNDLTEAAWSPDSRRLLLSHSARRTAGVYEAHTGKRICLLEGHTGYVMYGAWHPGGRHVATSAVDTSARLWDAASGEELERIVGLGMTRQRLSFHPTRDELLTCGERVRRWRFSLTGEPAEEIAELPSLEGGVRPEARFTLDGRHVLMWHVRGQMRLVPLDPVERAHALDRRPLSEAERRALGLDPLSSTTAEDSVGSLQLSQRAHAAITDGAEDADKRVAYLLQLRPRWPRSRYLAARLHAHKAAAAGPESVRHRQRALEELARAIEFGLVRSERTYRWFRKDPEWLAFESDPAFVRLREQVDRR